MKTELTMTNPDFLKQPRWRRWRGRLYHLYFRFARGMTLGVQGCVLDNMNRVFLVRHTYVPGWHFPGGGVETGETVLQALTRELAEEGNLHMTAPPCLFGVFFNRRTSPRDHVMLFVIRAFTQTAPRSGDHEIAETGFFQLNDLPKTIHPSTYRHLQEILESIPPSQIW